MANKTIFLTPEAESIWELEFNETDRNFSKWIQDRLIEIGQEKEKLNIEEVDKNLVNLELEQKKLENEVEFWKNRKIDILAQQKLEDEKLENERKKVVSALATNFPEMPEEVAEEISQMWVKDNNLKYHDLAEKRGYKSRFD